MKKLALVMLLVKWETPANGVLGVGLSFLTLGPAGVYLDLGDITISP